MLPPGCPGRIHIAFGDHRQVANARLILLTRRAIWDSDSPNTFFPLATPAGRMAEDTSIAARVMATVAPWASAVIPALPVAPGEGGPASERLSPASDSAATRASSSLALSAACSGVSMPRPRLRGWTAVNG